MVGPDTSTMAGHQPEAKIPRASFTTTPAHRNRSRAAVIRASISEPGQLIRSAKPVGTASGLGGEDGLGGRGLVRGTGAE